MKKILITDDSALMRRVLCDIINADSRFNVEDQACNGLEALNLLRTKSYDGMVLDVNMPQMDGIELLKKVKEEKIPIRIMMASTVTKEGAEITMEALELGAMDFVHKPDWSFKCKEESFKTGLLDTLWAVCNANLAVSEKKITKKDTADITKFLQRTSSKLTGERIVAIATSTGGPKALQSVIPLLPKNLDAPVVIVQHMPEGFTASLAQRLNNMSTIKVVEAKEGEVLEKGCVYIAKAGLHLILVKEGKNTVVNYTSNPPREGVRPCANYMFESLSGLGYEEDVCVVMTGMGADGTEGIKNLKASKAKAFVITQEGESCVVNGMPKSCVKAGMSDQIVTLDKIAQEIILRVGVKKDGC